MSIDRLPLPNHGATVSMASTMAKFAGSECVSLPLPANLEHGVELGGGVSWQLNVLLELFESSFRM
jgi:hypothetical protein